MFEQDKKSFERHSSKGNQLKWERDGVWYKADYTGYESLAEYMTSHLLAKSSLKDEEYVVYDLEKIKSGHQVFNGVKSKNMLESDWQIITLERAYKNNYGISLNEAVWKIPEIEERVKMMVDCVEHMTGLHNFGEYVTKLFTVDAFFKNEDRHMHNIALLMNGNGDYKLCPIFDNGGALLSDTRLDYPLNVDVFELMDEVKSRTVCRDFDEQLDAAEKLYGSQIKFSFTKKDVDDLLSIATCYSKEEVERVRTVIYQQMRKYQSYFTI